MQIETDMIPVKLLASLSVSTNIIDPAKEVKPYLARMRFKIAA